MALRHPRHEENAHEHVALYQTEAVSLREPFGAAQVVALAAGIFFVVVGAVGLARGGIDSVTDSTVRVVGLRMTPLLAAIHLIAGTLLLAGAAGRAVARGILGVFGPLLIAAGIVALIQRSEALGWNEVNGLAYVIAGSVALLAVMLTPVASVEERRVSAR